MKKRTRLLLILVATLCLCLGFGVFAACKNEPKKHVHEYTAWAHDGTYHWKECPVDDVADESTREEHTMVDGKCTVCDYQEAPPAHVHTYTELRSDATNHWNECAEDGDYIAQFGHIYDEEGKCIVCGKEGTAPEEFELDERKWYIVGNGAGGLLNASWDHLRYEMAKAEKPDANGYTVYTYQTALYAGDQFKFVQDILWDDGLGYYSFSDLANTSGVFRDAGGGNITPQAGNDGVYQFIIRTKPDLGPTSVMVEWKLVEPLEPLDVEEQFDMYMVGRMKATGKNEWLTTPDQMVKMNLMPDGETFYTVVEIQDNDEFKVYNLKTNAYFPDGTGNNLRVNKTTVYVVTWKIGDRNPVIEEYHHIHSYGEYLHDATNHWRVCVQDGEEDAAYGKVEHDFGEDNFCDVCGYEKADKPECETHTWGTDNVCTVCGRHWVYTEGLTYQINDKRDGYYVKGLHEDTDPTTVKELVVPYYFNGRPVVGIADNAFYDGTTANSKHSAIKKIVLPDTVKTIGENAFRKLTGLTSVKLGAGVEEIGASAFRDSVYIPIVTLPEGLKAIGSYAFSNVRMTEITLPSTLTELGSHAFETSYLVNVTFADGIGLKAIGAYAFASTYLKEIVLPESVETLDTYVFNQCTALTDITIPAQVVSIGNHTFDGCEALENVTFAAADYWKYTPTISVNSDWFVLAAETAGDPAAAAAWVKENAQNYLAVTEAHEHDYALCSSASNHWYRCKVCGALRGAREQHKVYDGHCVICGEAHTTHSYSWVHDEFYHWKECPADGTMSGSKQAHTWNAAGTQCTTCFWLHKHTYAEDWTFDATNHWHVSTCGHDAKSGNAAHTYGPDNICTTCGYERIWQGDNNGTPGLAFEFNSEYTGLIVTGFKTVPSNATEIVIPETCGTWPVLEIAAEAFKDTKLATVKKVVIPDTVKIIRANAFQNLTGLNDLTMSVNVYKIEQYAFAGCAALPAITLPEVLKTLPEYAFNGCTALASINLENLTDIGGYAFQNCKALDNVKLSKDLTVVRGYTFDGCSSLNTIDFGGVKVFGDKLNGRSRYYAFRGCGFVTLTLPEGFTDAGQYTFQNCTKLTKVVFPKEYTLGLSNAPYMFDGCTSLADVNFENVPLITNAMFQNCGFVNLTIPATCKFLSSGANYFNGCKKLETVTVNATSLPAQIFWNCTALTTATFQGNTIGNYAFAGCTSLKTVNFPAGVLSIGNYAFQNCAFTEITIPNTVTTIQKYAFSGCKQLARVTLPAGLTEIAESTFSGCAALTNMTLPATVTTIGSSAFSGCTLYVPAIPAGVTSIGSYAFQGTALTTFTVPAGVIEIKSNTFKDCKKLTTVDFGTAQITTIGSGAFSGCTLLNGITLPAGITSIESDTFNGCAALTAIEIPAGVTKIGSSAFKGTAITTITIPEKVTTIASSLFANCANLATVNFGTAKITEFGANAFQNCTSLAAISIPETVTKIGNYAFAGCTLLDNVTLPTALTSLGTYVFQNCTALKAITIPEKVTSVGNYSFDGCTSLATVDLGTGVKTIGQFAFQNCTALTTITIPAQVDTISVTAFKGAGLTEVTFTETADWLVASTIVGKTGTAVADDLTDTEAAATLLKENSESTSKYFRRVPKA